MSDGEIVGIGVSIPRKEDARFLRGLGKYSDDLRVQNQLYAAFVRSDRAHARICSVNSDGAKAQAGVIAVLTGLDYRADGHGPILHNAIERDPAFEHQPAFGQGDPVALTFPQWPLAIDKVRQVGEPVAIVVAESLETARKAAGHVEVAFDELPAVMKLEEPETQEAELVWEDAPGNVCVRAIRGQPDRVSEALARSDHVVSGEFTVTRVASCFMEPRSGMAEYDQDTGKYTLRAGNQGVHRFRSMIAGALMVEPSRVRVVCPDTGGGFGSRGHVNPEYVVIAWAAQRLGLPVKFLNDRSESFLTDWQGRDMVLKGELGLDTHGRITAYRLEIRADNGAYTVCYAPQANASRLFTTVYDVPVASLDHRVFLTNTASVLPYRAAGRPEVTYAIERLMDRAARKLALDRREIRLVNLIPVEEMPYTNPAGFTYDVGDFGAAFRRATELADWDGFELRQREAEERGLLRGIAATPFVESPVGAPVEMVRVRVGDDGIARLEAGTQNHGQGHETTYSQVVSELLGIPFDDVVLIPGDSDALPIGGGTHSDRSMRMVGELLCEAADLLIAQAKPVAARLLQVAEDEIIFEEGQFRNSETGAALGIVDVARSQLEPGESNLLMAEAQRHDRIAAFPYGTAVAEVVIDPETGELTIDRYTAVDDSGTLINPMIVHGQVHGGIVQGVGQALGETVAYDQGTGQMLTGSFMDYPMPRADQFPPFRLGDVNVRTSGNRLGVKAGGEAGTVPSLAVIGNAVLDALRPLGVTECEMPFTAHQVWNAIKDVEAHTDSA